MKRLMIGTSVVGVLALIVAGIAVSQLPAIGAGALCCQQVAAQSKDAEPATQAANQAFIAGLPFASQTDFEDAKRGFIATLPDGMIAGPGDRPAWAGK